MSRTKKIVIISSCILFVCLVVMGITLGAFISKTGNVDNIAGIFQGRGFGINESSELDLEGIDALQINCTSANIHIVESGEARAELKGFMVPAAEQKYLSVYEEGGTLFVKVESNMFLFSMFNDFNLTVYLPKENMLRASVNCTSGDIDITRMQFRELAVWRTSGNLAIKDCTADKFETDASSGDTRIESSALASMKLTCRSGEINVSKTSGTLYARATSGDISIGGAADGLDIGCTSGDVTIDIAEAQVPPITAGMTSGNIRIYMPADAAFDLSAKTTSGNVSSNIDVAVSGSSLQSFVGEDITGKCNGGGAPVSISVTSGDISIIAK